MTQKDKLLSMLAMAKKAGFLLAGFDTVKESLLAGKAKAAFVSAECSPKTKKETAFFAAKAEITVVELPVSMSEIDAMIRKKAGVISVTDEGFARRIEALASEATEEECR